MDKARQVREVLSARGLSLYSVSQKSAALFGRSSEYYVAHNLYSLLTRTRQTPTICEMLALSQITGYRLFDWLRIFGIELDKIHRLRLIISGRRTVILDSRIYDTQAWIPWFAETKGSGPIPPIAPLSQLLHRAPPRRAKELMSRAQNKFFYALVGEQDVYALPHFAPGSVIRARASRPGDALSGSRPTHGTPFFLVEYGSGWACSRLIAIEKDRVLLHCPQWPCMDQELRIGGDAKILGIIDAEIRPMKPSGRGIQHTKPERLPPARRAGLLRRELDGGGVLRLSRRMAGLSFREASVLSRQIARLLSDDRYFCAASTLSDYEALATPPQQIQKIITFCILYGIEFEPLLRAYELPIDQAGREPIPDEHLARELPQELKGRQTVLGSESDEDGNGFLKQILDQWEEIPLFLRFSLAEIAGIKDFSLANLFWIGGDRAPRHPLLVNAALVAVNRKSRKVPEHTSVNTCDRPLYLILTREHGYLCGRCWLDGDNLVLDGYPRGGVAARSFKNGIDAEVLGRVTAILRRFY